MKFKLLRLRVKLYRSITRFVDTPDHSHNTLAISPEKLDEVVPVECKDLYNIYKNVCETYPSKIAFYNPETYYPAILERIQSRGAFLQKQGYKPGDIIALLGRNSAEWCISYMAITSIGAIVLVLDFNLPATILKEMMLSVPTKALFGDTEFLKPEITNFTTYLLDAQEATTNAADFTYIPQTPETIASLLFTSGTTSNPKIVQLNHRNIYATSFGAIKFLGRGKENTFLSILPLYHVYGFVAGFMAPFCAGFGLVFQASFKSSELLKTLQDHSIQYFPCVPQILETFLDKALKKIKDSSPLKYALVIFILENAPSIRHLGLGFLINILFKPVRKTFGFKFRYFVSGGARLGRKPFLYFQRMGLNIIEGYGLTETTGPIIGNIPENPKAICVGSPLPGMSVQIRNLNREGIGDIWVKGWSVMPGYYNNPDLNDLVFDREGWFNTGDLGFLDKDKQLHIRGRKKNVIVLDSGKNVYPEELEGYYLQSELIEEICIFGRRINGKEVVYAVIKPPLETTSYAEIKTEIKKLNIGLPSYKAISQYALSKETLPRTSTQKVIVREVIKQLDAGKYITT